MADSVLGLVPTMMGVGLLGENLSYLKDGLFDVGSMVKLGFTNILGTALIGITAGTI